jgi:protein ImuB
VRKAFNPEGVMHWIALQTQPEAAAPEALADALLPAPQLADPLGALGWWALQFTPKVARLEDALLMEVSASERLLGGRRAMLRQIFTSNKPVAAVHCAQAATSLIALARLQLPASAPLKPDDLPLTALSEARVHLPTLARIGCTHWGQLRALPRGGVVRRFGAGLLDALDQAYGDKPELYPWLELPEVFFAKLELAARVDNASALMFGARRLLAQLHVWLQARQRGILALELGWEMDVRRQDAAQGHMVLRTAEPTLDMGHLQRLLAEHLARVTLHAPALYLHLRSLETAALSGATASLLPDEVRKGDSLHHLLERLSARLGADHVLHAMPCADHRPERMQVWQPASKTASSKASASAINSIASTTCSTLARSQKGIKNCGKSDALYPTWLLAQPLKLAVRHHLPQWEGPLTLLAGPQRLEAGWWGAAQDDGVCALRDYFLARSEHMGLLWIYQERLGGQGGAHGLEGAEPDWYLHGVFG